MAVSAGLREALAELVGPENVLAGPETLLYAVDGITPRAVVSPETREQVRELVRFARSRRLGIVPFGGGTKVGFGNPPAAYDLAVVTRRLSRVVDYSPADLTVVVEAGLTFGRLADLLRREGQFLPFDPVGPDRATVGGIVAAGLGGLRRAFYGPPRDWVLGIQAVVGEGELIKGGGRTVKNVSGYDLCRLFTGSWGSLGIIVEVCFKVFPMPPKTVLVVLGLPPSADLFGLGLQLWRGVPYPAAILGLDPASAGDLLGADAGPGGALLVLFSGVAADIDFQLGRTRAVAGDWAARFRVVADGELAGLWARLCDHPHWVGRDLPVWVRISVPPAAAGALAPDLVRGRFLVDLPGGIINLYPDPAEPAFLAELRRRARAAGGSLALGRAPADLKDRIPTWDPLPAPELMARVKGTLDPDGILSPGRLLRV